MSYSLKLSSNDDDSNIIVQIDEARPIVIESYVQSCDTSVFLHYGYHDEASQDNLLDL